MDANLAVTPPPRPRHAPAIFVGICTCILLLAAAPFARIGFLWPRLIAILVVGWLLPGLLLLARWRLPHLDLFTAAAAAASLGWCWLVLVALCVHWLPGPVSQRLLLAAYGAGALFLLVALAWPRPLVSLPRPSRQDWSHFALLLLVAAALRLPGLGYHELHFDEVLVLTRAREATRGEDDAFARHAKGPGELAVALVVYRALGTANETAARLPFALASVASVLATAAIGRRLFSPSVGLWAGLLLALNGFALGLSRLVQYQPAVLLLTAVAFLAAWEFAQTHNPRWFTLAAVVSAFGLVMHYEFGLMAPVLTALTIAGLRKSRWRLNLPRLAVPVVAGAVLVGAVYLPILFNPYFETTQNYLGSRLGRSLNFNAAFFVEMGTFYNSIYFCVGLLLLAAAGLAITWRVARFAGLALLLWFLPFLVAYLFVLEFPGTHFYLLMESWSLLGAVALVVVWRRLTSRPPARWLAAGLLAAWLALSAGYLYLMFFRQQPEYLVNFQRERVSLYWAPYGANVPQKPRFGFPIFEGWKSLGVLGEWHYLEGSYASNEGSRHLRWYLGGLERVAFDEGPDFLFVASHLQEPDPAFDPRWLDQYHPAGEIRVRGEARIALFAREPLDVPYLIYDAERFVSVFDRVVPAIVAWPDPLSRVLGANLAPNLTLEWGNVADTNLVRGETLHVLLWWYPLQPLERDYKVFVQIGAGQPVARWDGFPRLNTARTSRWQADKTVKDQILLEIPAATRPGRYPVLIGVYDSEHPEPTPDAPVEIATIRVW